MALVYDFKIASISILIIFGAYQIDLALDAQKIIICRKVGILYYPSKFEREFYGHFVFFAC